MLETVFTTIRTILSPKTPYAEMKEHENPSMPTCDYRCLTLDSDAYYIFVIGYDLMHEQFMTLEDTSCDTVFELAKSIWRRFQNSQNEDWCFQSTYENLRDFICENDFLTVNQKTSNLRREKNECNKFLRIFRQIGKGSRASDSRQRR